MTHRGTARGCVYHCDTDARDSTELGTVLGDGTGEYLWGQGLASQVTAGATTYAQSDGLGSVRLLTDATGNVAGRQSFDPYGVTRGQSGMQLPFGFTGEQTYLESGLVYLRARYMDPSTGRFLTRDSFGGTASDPQSLNRYVYVGDQPTTQTDPSGRCIGPLLAMCIAAVVETAPENTALGGAVVSSPILVTMISEQLQGVQSDVDTLLCPRSSSGDRVGASVGLTIAAISLIPFGEDILGTSHNLLRPTQDWINPDVVEQYIERLKAGGETRANRGPASAGKWRLHL